MQSANEVPPVLRFAWARPTFNSLHKPRPEQKTLPIFVPLNRICLPAERAKSDFLQLFIDILKELTIGQIFSILFIYTLSHCQSNIL
jgi:hypothetical protein